MEQKRKGKIGESTIDPSIVEAPKEIVDTPEEELHLVEKTEGEKDLPAVVEEKAAIIIPEKIKERAQKWILSYYNQKGAFPSIPWIASKIGQSRVKTGNVLKALEADNFLCKKGNRYTIKSVEDGTGIPAPLEKVKAMAKMNPWMFFIKGVLFIIGIGATYMSIYHSIGFLQGYYSLKKAIVSGILMIVFNVMAAEIAVFFRSKNLTALWRLFTGLWVLGTLFSMTSTVIGMYNQRAQELAIAIIKENIGTQENHDTDLKYQNLKERKEQALANLEGERKKRDTLVETISLYTPEMIDKDLENYNKLNGRRYIADTRVDSAQDEYNLLVEQESSFLTENTIAAVVEEKPADAYTWIGGEVFPGVRPEMIQFWMSVYPALFYDIIAPVSLSIVFFLPGDIKKKPIRKKKKLRRKKK